MDLRLQKLDAILATINLILIPNFWKINDLLIVNSN